MRESSVSAEHLDLLRNGLTGIAHETIREWASRLADTFSSGHRLLAAGNGGSAAQAHHLVAELVGRFRDERAALPAVALCADTAVLTAVANDYGYDQVFARQVAAHGRPGDVLLLFSTSGRSPNLLAAAGAARGAGLTVLAVTGPGPTPLSALCDDTIAVAAPSASVVQECQLVVVHLLCAEIDAARPERSAPLVVVGDSLLDRDVVGRVRSGSPEPPAPAVDERETVARPGGAGLAAVLAATRGRPVTLVTALADDADGRELAALLAAHGVRVIDLGRSGPTPRRLRVRADDRTLIMVAGPPGTRGEPARPLSGDERAVFRDAAAVLVSDYAEGLCGNASVRDAIASAAERVPVVWDPHERGGPPVPGVRVVTPNDDQARALTGRPAGRTLADDVDRARDLLSRWGTAAVALTRGARGAVLVEPDGAPHVVPGEDVRGGDTCGAGDRFAVEVAVRLAGRELPSEAVAAAVRAATGYVRAGGPGVLAGRPGPAPGDAVSAVERVRARGGTVVATGGCFDILHTGHVTLLERARDLGDCLVVCLNDDRSVRRLKGPSRPVTPLVDRIRVLRSLAAVDQVEVFSEDLPVQALRRIRPDVWVKGGDYRLEDIAEADVVAGWGGRTVVLPYVSGRSTSRLISSLAGPRQESSSSGR